MKPDLAAPPVAPDPAPPVDWPTIVPVATRIAALAAAAAALAAGAWAAAVVAVLAAAAAPPLVRTALLMRALAWLPGPTPVNTAERVLGCAARMHPGENYVGRVLAPWVGQHGGIFKVRALWRPLVVVTDPVLATWALSRGAALEKSTTLYFGLNLMSDPHGAPTLLSQTTASPDWKATRKAVAPAFAAGALKSRFPAIAAAAAAAADAVAGAPRGAPVDVDALLAAEACDVVATAGFGIDVGAVAETAAAIRGAPPPPPRVPGVARVVEQLHAATHEAETYIVQPWRAWRIAAALPSVRAGARVLASFRATVDAVLAAAAQGGADGGSIYGRLRAAACGDAAALRREAGLLFFAAVDTSSHTSAYTLALLAAHPDAGARASAELAAAGLLATADRPRPAPAAPADVSAARLPYLHACIKESMRLLPVAGGGTSRLIGRGGARVAGGHVPAGAELWIPFYAMHRATAVWGPDAAAFRPDRWLGDTPAAGPEHARRFTPFSAGARSCVGQALAEINVAVALVTLWGRYEWRWPEAGSRLPRSLGDLVASTTMAVTLQPRGGVWLVARPRVEREE